MWHVCHFDEKDGGVSEFQSIYWRWWRVRLWWEGDVLIFLIFLFGIIFIEIDRTNYSYTLMNCYCENKSILIFKHFICVCVYDCIYSCKIISWFSFFFYLLCMCSYIFELLISLLYLLSWIVSVHWKFTSIQIWMSFVRLWILCEGLFLCGYRCMLCCAVWFVYVIFFPALLLQFQVCLWCFCLVVLCDRLCSFNFAYSLLLAWIHDPLL
jgi:hypothetical protein